MTIEELKAIVNHCETNPKERVMLNVVLPNGTKARAEIESFGTYTDALVLNAKID
jgi:sRNA-binding regulator protein Hfq